MLNAQVLGLLLFSFFAANFSEQKISFFRYKTSAKLWVYQAKHTPTSLITELYLNK